MSHFSFRTSMTFELDRVLYRIARLPSADQVLLERHDDGQLTLSTRAELLKAYADGRVVACAVTRDNGTHKLFGRPLKELPPATIKELERRRAYVLALTECGSFVFTTACLDPLIRQVAERLGDSTPPSVITLYRWYSRYRIHRDTRALIPRHDLRGSRLVRQSDRVLELAADAIAETYAVSPAASVQKIYDRLEGKVRYENQHRLVAEQLKLPSRRTLYRLIKRVEAYDATVFTDGKSIADKRFHLSKSGPRVANILERVEIDHTPLDLFLVHDETGLPLGRPILTMLIDWYSRFPLGYYLNFGGTSAAAVMGALRHAVLPKESPREIVRQLHVEHHWPCYGRIDTLVLDNGLEFHGFDLESVAFDLDMRLQYCPKHQPRFKGAIERFLKTVNYFFTHHLPGTSLARLEARGDYDSQKHAVLTLAEFEQIFQKWLLDVYAQTVHRGIGMTPWAKWEEGAKRRTPELPASIQQLKQRIGLVEERTLGRGGITLNDIRYAGNELHSTLCKWGFKTKVRIVYDPDDLGSIQVWPPEHQDPITVPAVNQEYARGLTLIQHQLIRQSVQEKGRSTQNPEALAEAKYQLILAVDALLTSRRQRDRRRAAKVRGITSGKPEGYGDAKRLPVSEVAKAASSAPRIPLTPPAELAAFPSFQLTPK